VETDGGAAAAEAVEETVEAAEVDAGVAAEAGAETEAEEAEADEEVDEAEAEETLAATLELELSAVGVAAAEAVGAADAFELFVEVLTAGATGFPVGREVVDTSDLGAGFGLGLRSI
jgi:hypothetical protein